MNSQEKAESSVGNSLTHQAGNAIGEAIGQPFRITDSSG
jgi:hypothetical protein